MPGSFSRHTRTGGDDTLSRRGFLQGTAGFGAAAVLGGRVIGQGAEPQQPPAAGTRDSPPAAPSTPRKKLIAWGGIDWYSPEKVQANVRAIEELPFDGMVLQGFKAVKAGQDVHFDWLSFGRERFTRDEVAPAIETLAAIDFQRFTDNLLRYNVTPGDVDWFEDFSPILDNARL